MVRVSVMYPSGDNVTFDLDYYLKKHIPMVQESLGSALKGVEVDSGLAGRLPGSPPPYVAIAHLVFDSVEAFQNSMGPYAEKFAADVPNYTNTSGDLQVSEITT
jgi:uncharacterized protein (TIGR02118 family)